MARGQRLPDRAVDDNSGSRGNSFAAEFGGIDAVNAATGSGVVNGVPDAPAKASAAPKGASTKNLFTGLCEALNTWQQSLVKEGTFEKADVYEVVFVPASMANAQLKKPGNTDQSHTPMQQGTTAKTALDPATNTVNVTGRTVSLRAGTQVIQFIDQVIKNSTYISEQQIYQNNEVTQQTKKNPNGEDRPTAWYKVSAQVTSLGPDAKRNDHAYKITYIVTPYGINETRSEYFPKTAFRGVHKHYDYWFTGQNNAILNYEQNFNFFYLQTISEALPQKRIYETNPDILYKKSWQTRSNQSDQYATGNTNEPAANMAEFLYSPEDFGTINLKVVGDPAWIAQGETAAGISENNFSFAAFNSDDTINFDAQEVTFSVAFNQPEDYNFDTGLMEVAANFKKQNGEFGRNYPSIKNVYKTVSVKHNFSRGSFTQDIEGTLYQDVMIDKPASSAKTTEGRPRRGPTDAQIRAADEAIAAGVKVGNSGSSMAAEFGGNDDLLLATGSVEPPSNSTVPPNTNRDTNTQPLRTSRPTSTSDIINVTGPIQNPNEDDFIIGPTGQLLPRPGRLPDANNKPPQQGNRET